MEPKELLGLKIKELRKKDTIHKKNNIHYTGLQRI